jgi:hypothetical protein
VEVGQLVLWTDESSQLLEKEFCEERSGLVVERVVGLLEDVLDGLDLCGKDESRMRFTGESESGEISKENIENLTNRSGNLHKLCVDRADFEDDRWFLLENCFEQRHIAKNSMNQLQNRKTAKPL